MKKLILMAMLLCFATTAVAQMPKTPDPQQQQIIKNAEAERMKTYNQKGNTLKQTDFKKLDEQDKKTQQALKEQEKQAKAAADAAKEQKKAYEEQEKKARSPISVTLSGRLTDPSAVHLANAYFPILFRLPGRVTERRLAQR